LRVGAKDRAVSVFALSMITTRRLRAVGFLAALMMPLGAAVHVFWEIAAVGVTADFAGRHSYLLGLLTLSIVILVTLAARGGSTHDRRRSLTLLIADLPKRGRGPEFAALAVGLQIGFAALTLALEGTAFTPLGSLGSLACAVLAAILGALLLDAGAAPLVAIAAALTHYIDRDRSTRCAVRVARRYFALPHLPRARAYALFVPNRPPPNTAPISA
jgi:hypothetical protein